MRFSTRLIGKGALIDETRIVLRHAPRAGDILEEVRNASVAHLLGARSEAWAREIRTTLSSRFSVIPRDDLSALADLACSDASREVWSPCLHWFCARSDQFYYRFMTEWLSAAHRAGTYRIRSQDLMDFVRVQVSGLKGKSEALSPLGEIRAARDLLRMAGEFGILRGSVNREFAPFHLPEESMLFLLQCMVNHNKSARTLIESPDWQIYMMDTDDVERELLRLHQYRKLQYEVAGSLVRLELPFQSAAEYARELSA